MLADAGRAVVSWVLLAHTASATWALAPWFFVEAHWLAIVVVVVWWIEFVHGLVYAPVHGFWSDSD
jgi:hypothetical protein